MIILLDAMGGDNAPEATITTPIITTTPKIPTSSAMPSHFNRANINTDPKNQNTNKPITPSIPNTSFKNVGASTKYTVSTNISSPKIAPDAMRAQKGLKYVRAK